MNWWAQIDRLATAVGMITAIPVFWSWFILLGYRRRQMALIESITRSRGDRPITLAISIARDTTTIDISNQVRHSMVSRTGSDDRMGQRAPFLIIAGTLIVIVDLDSAIAEDVAR